VDARAALASDQFVREALDGLSEVTLALVGIGALEPSSLLQSSGNIFSERELAALGKRGAVGDICLRFLDADGQRVDSDVDSDPAERAISQLEQRLEDLQPEFAAGPLRRSVSDRPAEVLEPKAA
jgi:DNA-binding transcriptional regulator LsrR (DeoR family)